MLLLPSMLKMIFTLRVRVTHCILTETKFILFLSYTTGKAVFGRCKIIAVVKTEDRSIEDLDDLPKLERYIDQFEGVIDFFFSMSAIFSFQ